MKRISSVLMIVFLPVFLSGSFADAETRWKGVVVYLDASSVMIKSGDYEKTFSLNKETPIEWSSALSAKNKGSALLEICQTVSVEYTAEKNSLTAKKFVILKESDCYK